MQARNNREPPSVNFFREAGLDFGEAQVGRFNRAYGWMFSLIRQGCAYQQDHPDTPYVNTAVRTLASGAVQEAANRAFDQIPLEARIRAAVAAPELVFSYLLGRWAHDSGEETRIRTGFTEAMERLNPSGDEAQAEIIKKYATLYHSPFEDNPYAHEQLKIDHPHLHLEQISDADCLSIYKGAVHQVMTFGYQASMIPQNVGDALGDRLTQYFPQTTQEWQNSCKLMGHAFKEALAAYPVIPGGSDFVGGDLVLNVLKQHELSDRNVVSYDPAQAEGFLQGLDKAYKLMEDWDSRFALFKETMEAAEGIQTNQKGETSLARLEEEAEIVDKGLEAEIVDKGLETDIDQEKGDALSVLLGAIDIFALIAAGIQEEANWKHAVNQAQERLDRSARTFGLQFHIRLAYNPTEDPQAVFNRVRKNLIDQSRTQTSYWLKNVMAVRRCFNENRARLEHHAEQVQVARRAATNTQVRLRTLSDKIDRLSRSTPLLVLFQTTSAVSGIACSAAVFNPALLPVLTGIRAASQTIESLIRGQRYRDLGVLQQEADREMDLLNRYAQQMAQHQGIADQVDDRLRALDHYIQENPGIISPDEHLKQLQKELDRLIAEDKLIEDEIKKKEDALKAAIAHAQNIESRVNAQWKKDRENEIETLKGQLRHAERIEKIRHQMVMNERLKPELSLLHSMLQEGNDPTYKNVRNWFNERKWDKKQVDEVDFLLKAEQLFEQSDDGKEKGKERFAESFQKWCEKKGITVTPENVEKLFDLMVGDATASERRTLIPQCFEATLQAYDRQYGPYLAIQRALTDLARAAIVRRAIHLDAETERHFLSALDGVDAAATGAYQVNQLIFIYQKFKEHGVLDNLFSATGLMLVAPQAFPILITGITLYAIYRNWGVQTPTEVGQLREFVEFSFQNTEYRLDFLRESLYDLSLQIGQQGRYLSEIHEIVVASRNDQCMTSLGNRHRAIEDLKDKIVQSDPSQLREIYLPKLRDRDALELTVNELDSIALIPGALSIYPFYHITYLCGQLGIPARGIPHIPLAIPAMLRSKELKLSSENIFSAIFSFFQKCETLIWVKIFQSRVKNLLTEQVGVLQQAFARSKEEAENKYLRNADDRARAQLNASKHTVKKHALYARLPSAMRERLDHLDENLEVGSIFTPHKDLDGGIVVVSEDSSLLPLVLPKVYLDGFTANFVKQDGRLSFVSNPLARNRFTYRLNKENNGWSVIINCHHFNPWGLSTVFSCTTLLFPSPKKDLTEAYLHICEVLYPLFIEDEEKPTIKSPSIYTYLKSMPGCVVDCEHVREHASSVKAKLIPSRNHFLVLSEVNQIFHIPQAANQQLVFNSGDIADILARFEMNHHSDESFSEFLKEYHRYFECFAAMMTIYSGSNYLDITPKLHGMGVIHPSVLQSLLTANPRKGLEALNQLVRCMNGDFTKSIRLTFAPPDQLSPYKQHFQHALTGINTLPASRRKGAATQFRVFARHTFEFRRVEKMLAHLASHQALLDRPRPQPSFFSFKEKQLERAHLNRAQLLERLQLPERAIQPLHSQFDAWHIEFFKAYARRMARSIVILQPGKTELELALYVRVEGSRSPYFLYWDQLNHFDFFKKNETVQRALHKGLPSSGERIISV